MLQNDVIKCCKMMSHSNNCCVVHEPAICEDLDLHIAIFILFTGGSASVHAGIPPQEQTPPEQTHPLGADTPPGSRHTPWEQTHPLGADTPRGSRHTPWSRHTPEQTPTRKQTPAYGLRAAGTHPTGMHSCSAKFSRKLHKIRMHSSWMRTVRCSGRRVGGWGVSA